jgi:hypothetical protein
MVRLLIGLDLRMSQMVTLAGLLTIFPPEIGDEHRS